MNSQRLPASVADDAPAWQQTVVAFLAEKERRSGSRRTVESYARMLWPFLTRVGSPDGVTAAHALAWAHGVGTSGREPSSATVGARIACLSSYYRFLIRMNLATSNPCDALERPRSVPAVPRGYSADEVRRLLAVISDTVAGRRDRALLLTFVLSGRRRTEVLSLTAGDLEIGESVVYYTYRGKGGKRGRRELPAPAYAAIKASLADIGKDPATMAPDESLWQAGSDGRGISSATFYGRFRRYLKAAGMAPTGLHVLRHSARQAAPRRRGAHRVGQRFPRPFVVGGDDRLPAQARRRGGWGLAGGRAGDRRLKPCTSA